MWGETGRAQRHEWRALISNSRTSDWVCVGPRKRKNGPSRRRQPSQAQSAARLHTPEATASSTCATETPSPANIRLFVRHREQLGTEYHEEGKKSLEWQRVVEGKPERDVLHAPKPVGAHYAVSGRRKRGGDPRSSLQVVLCRSATATGGVCQRPPRVSRAQQLHRWHAECGLPRVYSGPFPRKHP